MKFNVGDRVKFVKSIEIHSNTVKLGGIYKIKHVDSSASYMPYKVENGEWFGEGELLKEYTYEDLKKSPVGTKITFEDKQIFTKVSKKCFRKDDYTRYLDQISGMKDNFGDFGKIIKVEEPTSYITVYESKPEILDEAEKRYLRGVIRPYENDVIFITKFIISEQNAIAKITIKMKNLDGYWYIGLPPFKKDTMYKNMEDDKEYTLEELGL